MENIHTPKQGYKVMVRCVTYNQSKYICDTLDGFSIQQTNFPFLCLVVDDASKDGEQEVIKQYAQDNCDMNNANVSEDDVSLYIKVPHKTNSNCVYLFCLLKVNLFGKPEKQEIFKKWREICEYEACCEGDDYWITPDKLQKQVDFLDAHPEYVLSHTDCLDYKQSQDVFTHEDDIHYRNIAKEKKPEDFLRYLRIVLTLTTVIRIDVLKKIKDSDDFVFKQGNFLLGDVPMWYTASRMGKVHYLPEITSVYRVLDISVSHYKGGSNKNKYKFPTNAYALRLYFCKRDNLSESLTEHVRKIYEKNLIWHMAYNRDFKPLIPLSDKADKKLLFLHKLHLLPLYARLKAIRNLYHKLNIFKHLCR